MTKILSIVSHKNYNLDATVVRALKKKLPPNLITCFFHNFTLVTKSQSIFYLPNESEHRYILDFGP